MGTALQVRIVAVHQVEAEQVVEQAELDHGRPDATSTRELSSKPTPYRRSAQHQGQQRTEHVPAADRLPIDRCSDPETRFTGEVRQSLGGNHEDRIDPRCDGLPPPVVHDEH